MMLHLPFTLFAHLGDVWAEHLNRREAMIETLEKPETVQRPPKRWRNKWRVQTAAINGKK